MRRTLTGKRSDDCVPHEDGMLTVLNVLGHVSVSCAQAAYEYVQSQMSEAARGTMDRLFGGTIKDKDTGG